MNTPDLNNKTFYLALKIYDSFSDSLLLNFLICSLAELGANIVMVKTDERHTDFAAPKWFKEFSTGQNTISFVDKGSLPQGTYFIHNYDEIADQLESSKVVKINATNPKHINVPYPDRPMDLVSKKVLQALIVA